MDVFGAFPGAVLPVPHDCEKIIWRDDFGTATEMVEAAA